MHTQTKQIAFLRKALFALFLSSVLLVPGVVEGKSVSWSWNSSKPLHIEWSNSMVLGNRNGSVIYHAEIYDDSTGAIIPDNSSVSLGTIIRVEPVAHQSSDISWFGTGHAFDSPNGEWVRNADNTGRSCNPQYYIGSDSTNSQFMQNLYVLLSIHPPVKTVEIGGNASVTNLGNGKYRVDSSGTLVPKVNFDSTYGHFYYSRDGDGGCTYRGVLREKTTTGAYATYELPVLFNQIVFTLTAVANSTPPTVPTLAGPTTGTTGVAYAFTAQATDPDNDTLKYGMDWDNNGSVDEWMPTSSFVASNTTQDFTHRWITSGDYTFKALAQDSKGANSGWSQPFTITIADTPADTSVPSCTSQVVKTCVNDTCKAAAIVSQYGGDYSKGINASTEYQVTINGNVHNYVASCRARNGESSCSSNKALTIDGQSFAVGVRGRSIQAGTCISISGGFLGVSSIHTQACQIGVRAEGSITGCSSAPELSFAINNSTGPLDVPLNSNLSLVWDAKNVTSCSGYGANWVSGDDIGTSGTTDISATASDTYIISCTGPSGNVFKSVQVNLVNTLKICENSCSSSIEVQPAVAMAKGDTKNLVACYNTATSCTDTTGDVTTSATWTEGGGNPVSLSGSNPKTLTADNTGTESIQATYGGNTVTRSVTVTCTDSGACQRDSRSQSLCQKDNFTVTDNCGQVQSCTGEKTCDYNWREVEP